MIYCFCFKKQKEKRIIEMGRCKNKKIYLNLIINQQVYNKCTRILIFIPYLNDNSYSQKNTVTEPILISISQNASIIPVTKTPVNRKLPMR